MKGKVHTMTKMTYAMALEIAINAVADNAEVAEKLTALRAQIEKKNSAERKPTKKQVENEGYKSAILAVLTEKPMTITEIVGLVPELAELSNQRVSAMLTAMTKGDKPAVVRSEYKRKAYFAKVA